MPPRELIGPAGRLEALLEEPQLAGAIGHDGRVSSGHPAGLRAAVVLAHPLTSAGGTMHTKVVYQATKALSRIGCAVLRFQLPRRRCEHGHVRQRSRRAGRFPRRTRLHGGAVSRRATLGGGDVVRILGCADRRHRGSPRLGPARHRAAGHALRLQRWSSAARSRSFSSRASSTR